jgi:type I restriction enzyme M protein
VPSQKAREKKRDKKRQRTVFLNPRTCGINKKGVARYKSNPLTGMRTDQIDNELLDHVTAFLGGGTPPGMVSRDWNEIQVRQVLVPTYYDPRYQDGIESFLKKHGLKPVTLQELIDDATVTVRGGHGSPSNDQRRGNIPYIKVSDIRGLRLNVNPTNLVPEALARRYWGGASSGLQAWDVVTPNRASSNIGEFAMLLPGEERVVLTREVFVLRLTNSDGMWDPFYLLWALSLRDVREQWRRIALMQTNREDCGDRYGEIIVPLPPSRQWARQVSSAFREYFQGLATAKQRFVAAAAGDPFEYVPTIYLEKPAALPEIDLPEDEDRSEDP